jgi:hypothetical protein
VDIQTISIVIAASGVFIAAINQILSSRRAEKQRELTQQTQQQALETRQARLFMQLYNRWNSRELRTAITKIMQWTWKDLDDYMKKYDEATNLEAHVSHLTVVSFFEGIGVLVERGLIDVTLVYDLLWNAITIYWEKFGPIWKEWRKPSEYPGTGKKQFADHTEYLYNQIQRIQQQAIAST